MKLFMLLPRASGMFMGACGSDIEEEMVTEDEKCPKLKGHALSCSMCMLKPGRMMAEMDMNRKPVIQMPMF